MTTKLELRPNGYLETHERIVFFAAGQSNIPEEMIPQILKAKTLVITAYRSKNSEVLKYTAFVGRMCFNFAENNQGKYNFHLTNVYTGKDFDWRRNKLYFDNSSPFTIIPRSGIEVVYKNNLMSLAEKSDDPDWNMNEDFYISLVNRLREYFNEEKIIGETRDDKKTRLNKVEANVLSFFEYYTDKEDFVEREAAETGNAVSYYDMKYEDTENKSAIYSFFSDPGADPNNDIDLENTSFKEGSRISVVNGKEAYIPGTLLDSPVTVVDDDNSYILYRAALDNQTDHAAIPTSGKIMPAINDSQTRVRNKVLRLLRSSKAESQYMYKTFADFSVDGYNEPDDKLTDFLAESLDAKYPPNQMQLEAIIKGILTKDLLLVLGPPGTGKTTVIRRWAKYFTDRGMRVLISSQNNAAVDNVLQAFIDEENIEIVRLGNASKVLPSCHVFLPDNKIGTMRERFSERRDSVYEDLSNDEAELNKFLETCSSFSARVSRYERCIEDFRNGIKPITALTKMLDGLLNKYKNLRFQLFNNVNETVNIKNKLKRIESGNFILKFLARKRTYALQKALEEHESDKLRLSVAVDDTAIEYNITAEKLAKTIRAAAEQGLFNSFAKVKRDVEDLTRELGSRKFLPELCRTTDELYNIALLPVPRIGSDHKQTVAALNKTIKYYEENGKLLLKVVTETKAELHKWYDRILSERNDALQDILVDFCDIVGATCIGINTRHAYANMKFDVSIIDESGQIQIHNVLVPMSRAPKTLMLGDYKQIPPSANDSVVSACKAEGIKTQLLTQSFFEFLFQKLNEVSEKVYEKTCAGGNAKERLLAPLLPFYDPKVGASYSRDDINEMVQAVISDHKKTVNLNSQFRMPGNISDIISEWFYESNYHSGYDMKNFKPMVPQTTLPLAVVDTSDSENRFEREGADGKGYYNPYEITVIANMVEQIINSKPDDQRSDFISRIEKEIGIISAYGAQVGKISAELKKRKLGINGDQIRSMVAPLDSFQGQERPLIIFSFTRSSQKVPGNRNRVGFMKELRRLNVAFTRCKMQLVLVGDITYMAGCRKINFPEWYSAGDDEFDYPCRDYEERDTVDKTEIAQCAGCELPCEKKLARFIKLMMQYVKAGNGEHFSSENFESSYLTAPVRDGDNNVG